MMKKLRLTALSLLALAGMTSAWATEVEMIIDVAGVKRTVVITLDEDIAPKTSANFAKLSGEGFYDGISFHRVISNYIVQGGDPLTKDPEARAKWGTGGPDYTIPAEMGGKHVRGAVAAARLGDAKNPNRDSSGSQFYITLRDVPPLDGQYTVFGMVTSGLEVFDEIAGAPADANNVPKASIKIVSTSVKTAQPPAPVPAPAPTPSLTATKMPTAKPDPAPAATPAPIAMPNPVPAPTPAPGSIAATTPPPSAEPDPLSATTPSRFTPQSDETMPVNVDRGTPAMPRLQTNADKMVEAAKKLTGREDGFVPMTAVGGGNAPTAPSPAAEPAPLPSFPQEPAPQPGFSREPEPIPLSASEPDPLAASPTPAAPLAGPGAPVPPSSGEVPPAAAAAPKKPEKPAGPIGRFLRRIW